MKTKKKRENGPILGAKTKRPLLSFRSPKKKDFLCVLVSERLQERKKKKEKERKKKEREKERKRSKKRKKERKKERKAATTSIYCYLLASFLLRNCVRKKKQFSFFFFLF